MIQKLWDRIRKKLGRAVRREGGKSRLKMCDAEQLTTIQIDEHVRNRLLDLSRPSLLDDMLEAAEHKIRQARAERSRK